MISKSTLQYITSLHQKKYRYRHRAFLVEGTKSVLELLSSDFEVELLLATNAFVVQYRAKLPVSCKLEMVTEEALQKAGTFEKNNAVLAVVAMRENKQLLPSTNSLTIALDDVRDPGNLGTIIRIADWYGIKNIICSENCADFYNPKVIAASMGSFCRVQHEVTNLTSFLGKYRQQMPVYAAVLGGKNVNELSLKPNGILIMGNEANGISAEVEALATQKLTIQSYGNAESLNVAIATAILCDHFYRFV